MPFAASQSSSKSAALTLKVWVRHILCTHFFTFATLKYSSTVPNKSPRSRFVAELFAESVRQSLRLRFEVARNLSLLAFTVLRLRSEVSSSLSMLFCFPQLSTLGGIACLRSYRRLY